VLEVWKLIMMMTLQITAPYNHSIMKQATCNVYSKLHGRNYSLAGTIKH
jgi:hypothetical protein